MIITGGLDSVVNICKFDDEEIFIESSKSINPKAD